MSSFIVRLKESATEDNVKDAIAKFESHGGKILHNHTLFKGFTGTLPDDKAGALESLPHVEAIEKDQKVNIQ